MIYWYVLGKLLNIYLYWKRHLWSDDFQDIFKKLRYILKMYTYIEKDTHDLIMIMKMYSKDWDTF